MNVRVDKDKKGPTYIISIESHGFTRQVNVDIPALCVLHRILGEILAGRRK